jgi:hypothetical protein
MHHTTIVGMQPVGAMPPATRGRLLVELWKGDEPAPLPGTTPVAFAVEGTIIGDGRDWSGARLSPLADDAVLDVPAGSPEYIVTEIRAVINEWR